MAAGSSAPELFTAIVTTLITGGGEGLGTIVGSAVFNIMVIVGLTAIAAGKALNIWWFPLTRDCLVYVPHPSSPLSKASFISLIPLLR